MPSIRLKYGEKVIHGREAPRREGTQWNPLSAQPDPLHTLGIRGVAIAAVRQWNDAGVNGSARRLSGHVCVITGGDGGVGQATARRLAEEGATVVVVDRVEHEVGELCLRTDVTDQAQAHALYAQVSDELGRSH
jgi:glutamate dehydrogenase/leucine dehydrogenase